MGGGEDVEERQKVETKSERHRLKKRCPMPSSLFLSLSLSVPLRPCLLSFVALDHEEREKAEAKQSTQKSPYLDGLGRGGQAQELGGAVCRRGARRRDRKRRSSSAKLRHGCCLTRLLLLLLLTLLLMLLLRGQRGRERQEAASTQASAFLSLCLKERVQSMKKEK